MQLLTCWIYSLDWSLSTFLSPFIQFFLTPPLKPCGFFTFLIMKQHVSFSPNLYTTACQFYVMFLVTFKRERHGNRPFSFFRLTLLGLGLQKPISNKYQIINDNGLNFSHFKKYTNWHLSHLTHFFGEWINLPFRTVWTTIGFFWKYSTANLSKFQTHDPCTCGRSRKSQNRDKNR